MSLITRLKRAGRELLGRRQFTRASSYEEQIYNSLVCVGDACFDVGASIGAVSIYLSKLSGDTGSVIAFEPNWLSYRQLCRNVQSYAKFGAPMAEIISVPFGLADSEREATINVPNDDFGMGSIASASAWAGVQKGAQLRTYQVRLTTIDNFLASTSLRVPDFIKIDVEGAELFVLLGATDFFNAGYRPLMFIEVIAPWEQAFGYQPWTPLSWLMERGYQFLFSCSNGLVEHSPTEEQPFPPEFEMGYNIIAYAPSSHAERIRRLHHLFAGTVKSPGMLLPMIPPPQPNRIIRSSTINDSDQLG